MTKSSLMGLVLNAIVGIACGLAVRPIQSWYDRRGLSRSRAKAEQLRCEYHGVLSYVRDPNALVLYLLRALLRSALGLAVSIFGFVIESSSTISAISIGPSYVAFRIPGPGVWYYVHLGIRYLGDIGFIGGLYLVFYWVVDALSVWNRVHNFEKYCMAIPPEIRSPELEEIARGHSPAAE